MDKKNITTLENLVRNPTKARLEVAERILEREVSSQDGAYENHPYAHREADRPEPSAQILDLSLDLLQSSSRLLKREELGIELHGKIEETAMNFIAFHLSDICGNPEQGKSTAPDIDFKETFFSRPIILSNMALNRLRFVDCTFNNAVQFTAVSCRSPIEFSNSTFAGRGTLLIRMMNFPKPDPPSDWQPSFIFKDCSIGRIEAFRAEVFLFFIRSAINSSSLQLPEGSVTQYVDCHISDCIVHSTNAEIDGNDLVPQWWHKDIGWKIN